MSKKHGKIFSFSFAQLEYVIMTDPVDIRAVMNREEAQAKPRLYHVDHMMNFENAGILMADGEPWKERRRFCLRHLRDFGFGRSSSCPFQRGRIISLINTECSTASLRSWQISCISAVFLTNKRVTSANDDFKNMALALQQILSLNNVCALLSFAPSVLRWCPGWIYGEKQMLKLRSIVHDYLKSVIEEHQRTLDPASPRDLVDTFLIQRETNKTKGVVNDHFSDNALIVTLLDLFNAGHETTATTLRWFFLYMLEYPAIQAKIHAEIDKVIGKDREPQWADYPNMPYTVAAINELWRVANVVPNGADHTAEATFSYKGYTFPKGTNFLANLYAVHVNPEIWGDPENFRPERFLDKNGKFVKHDCLMPFEVGKRQCMGESLARIVTFLGIVYLLQLFSLEKVEGENYSLEANVDHSPAVSVPFQYMLRATPR